MTLGRYLRELWGLRKGLIISLCLALLASAWAVGKVSLFPPGVKLRPLTIAAATTNVLIDAPESAVSNLKTNALDITAMTNRALLVGNLMANPPVMSYIAHRAHLPAGATLHVVSPVTPDFPRQLTTSGKQSPTDILKSPTQYRLLIMANPTVPVLELDAEAPTVAQADTLANGAIQGVRDYLNTLGSQENVPLDKQVTLRQLGTAHGGVINPGVNAELGLLVFFFVFVASSATTLWLARVRVGWKRAGPGAEGLTAGV